jgi:predicted class III extradiol MEMO1 family dioxygenase
MNWRVFCKNELQNNAMKERILSWFDQYFSGDERILDVMKNQGIISFPHTVLEYSGEMITRVVTSLYASGVEKVIALGVIHIGALAEPYKSHFAELLDPKIDFKVREKRLEIFQGAFTRSDSKTAFGEISLIAPIEDWKKIRMDDSLLAGEFCLDYFLAILRLAADHFNRDPLPVIPIYSGASFDPLTDSFTLATDVAAEIAQLLGPKTVIVITGDLVHYGTTYSSKEEMDGKPRTVPDLEKYFLPLVEESFHLVAKEKHYSAAFDRLNRVLHSDQRFLLPVVGELLGDNASFEILEFHLSDYAPIWNVNPPCVVASSLVTFTHA